MPVDHTTREMLPACQTITINPLTHELHLVVSNDRGLYTEKKYDLSGLEIRKQEQVKI